MQEVLSSRRGSALPTVLMVTTIAAILATVYFSTQRSLFSLSFSYPIRTQSLLNSRSGITAGMTLLKINRGSNFERVNTGNPPQIDSLFGGDLFPKDSSGTKSSEKTATDTTFTLSISADSLLGSVDVTIGDSGFFTAVHSVGSCRGKTSAMVALVGAMPFTSPDTVLFLETASPVRGRGFSYGKTAFIKNSIDTSKTAQQRRFFLDKKELDRFVGKYTLTLGAVTDSQVLHNPVLIRYKEDFDALGDTVTAPLFLDGASRDLDIDAQGRVIFVTEEIQFTGRVTFKNGTLASGGDVKVLDKSELKGVQLFSRKTIFLANRSSFSGTAMAQGVVEIYDEAQVLDQSILIAYGKQKSSAQDSAKTLFAINVRDRAVVNGTLIYPEKTGRGVATYRDTRITGIIWSQGIVDHRGELEGIIRAKRLVGEESTENEQENIMGGKIREFPGIIDFILPAFLGTPAMVSCYEQ